MKPTVKAALVSVGSNGFLVAAKLVVGFVIGSVSIISEAIHSGNDFIAALIALYAVNRSNKPADEKHNFGHGKVENVSGTIEALLIFIAAAMIIKEAVSKLQSKGEVETVGWGIAVMGFSAVLNIFVSAFLMKQAKKHDSIALEADAMHLRVDVYTSVGVLGGLVLLKLTGWAIIDPIAAIGVALLIIKAAVDLTRKAFLPLLDTALSAEELAQIEEVLLSFKDRYVSYHDLRTRSAGRESHIDLHLVVPASMTVPEAHELCDQIEEQITARLPYANIVIHVEPSEGVSD